MQLKDIKTASKLFENLKSIDLEIKSIQKLAEKLVNGSFKIELKMSSEGSEFEKDVKAYLDNEGDLRIDHMHASWIVGSMFMGDPVNMHTGKSKNQKKDKSELLNITIEENTSLSILEVLLFQKRQEKIRILGQLKKLGVK